MKSSAIILISIIAFALANFIIPLIIRIDRILGIYSISSLRDLHEGKKPTAGGLAFYIPFLFIIVTVELLFDLPYPSLYLISLVTLAVTIGLIDDIWGIPPILKFIFISMICVIFSLFDVYVRNVIYPVGYVLELGNIGIILSIVLLFMIINGFNFLDGMDGLAASTALIILGGTVVINLFRDQVWLIYIAVPLMAVLLAFLRYNKFPSEIFMGDTGSLFLGTLISFIVFKTFTTEYSVFLFPMLLFLSIPLGEFLLSFLRRMHAGISPVQADKEHLHHKLLQLGLNQSQTLIVILILVAFSILLGSYVFIFHNSMSILFSTLFFFFLMGIIIRLGYFNLYNQTVILKPSKNSVHSISTPVPFKFESFIHKIILIIVDAIMVNTGFALFLFLKRRFIHAELHFTPSFELFFLMTMFWIMTFFLFNLYSLPWDVSIFYKMQRLMKAVLTGILFIGIMAFDSSRGLTTPQVQSLFVYGILIAFCVGTGRLLVIYTEGHFKILEYAYKNTLLIVSQKKQLHQIIQVIKKPGLLHRLMGYVTLEKKSAYKNIGLKYLGCLSDLHKILSKEKVDEIILGEFPRQKKDLDQLLSACVGTRVVLKIFPIGELSAWKRNLSTVSDYPLIRIFDFSPLNWQILVKRLIDIIVAIILLIIGFPLFIFCILNRFIRKETIFETKEIIGFRGKVIKVFLMKSDRPISGLMYRYCRNYPIFIKLLIGEISLIGITPHSLDWYIRHEKEIPFIYQRLLMKPGLISYSDLWSGYREPDEKELVEKDLFYIHNFSLTLDIRILLRAIIKYFKI